METIQSFFHWLFNDRMGVLALMVGGILLFLLIAYLLEKRMRKQFYNHKRTENDWDLFDSGDDSNGK